MYVYTLLFITLEWLATLERAGASLPLCDNSELSPKFSQSSQLNLDF